MGSLLELLRRQRKRRRRQDVTAYDRMVKTPNDPTVTFRLPANAYLAIRTNEDLPANAVEVIVGQRAYQNPQMQAYHAFQMGWGERSSQVTINNPGGYDIVLCIINELGELEEVTSRPLRSFSWLFRHRFNGVDGATTFANDEVAGLVLTGGTAVALTSTNPLEGVTSLSLGGVGSIAVNDNPMWKIAASTPFSLACKFRITSLATEQVLVSHWRVGTLQSWRLYVDTSGRLGFQMSAGGSATTVSMLTQTGQIAVDTNYEVMVDRDSFNNIRIYVNGRMMTRLSSSTTTFDSTTTLLIGADRNSGGTTTSRYTGLIDDVRWSNTTCFCGSDFGYNPITGNLRSAEYDPTLLPVGYTKINNPLIALIGPSTGERNGSGQGSAVQEQWTAHLATGYLMWAKRRYNCFRMPIWHANADPFFQGFNWARSSYNIANMTGDVPSVLASDADVVYVITGRNDISGVKLASDIIAEAQSLLNSLLGHGKLIIWEELYERDLQAGGVWASGGQARADLATINAAMIPFCEANGIVVSHCRKAQINTYATVANTWTGQITTDFIHVATRGAYRIGAYIEKLFRTLFDAPAAYNASDPANLAPNPSLTGSAGALSGTAAGVAPDSYTLTSTTPGVATGAQPGDGSYRVTFATNGAGGTGVEAKLTLTSDITGLNINDWYALRVRIKRDPSTATYAVIPHLLDRHATLPKHVQDCASASGPEGSTFSTALVSGAYQLPEDTEGFLEYETPPLKLTATSISIEVILRVYSQTSDSVFHIKDIDVRKVTDPTTLL